MVTLLDAGLLANFNSFFVFLFILVASYAILTSTKMFDNAGINMIIAIILALLSASSSTVSKTFAYATPWIVLLFGVLLMLTFILKFMGSEKTLFHGNVAIDTVVIVLIVVIFMVALGQVQKEKSDELAKQGITPVLTFPNQIGQILTNPAVLGLLLVFLIATFAVMLLSYGPSK